MAYEQLIADFIKNQRKAPVVAVPKSSAKAMKTSSKIMNPAVHAKPELTYAYIVEHKPKGKKVLKYLQAEIDAIMADADA
jgi:hypothetical protein